MARTTAALTSTCAALAIVLWLVLAAIRVHHPFELEWQEGGMLAHVERIERPEPLYAEPTLEFAAFPYPPLYVALAAHVARVVGVGFPALRAVSIAATMATLLLLFVLGAVAARAPFAGLLSAGVYAAGYRFAGAWFDVARVDPLEICFLCAVLAYLELSSGRHRAWIAGALAACAILTKQSAVVSLLPLAVGLAWRTRKDAWAFTGTALAIAGGFALAIERASAGWFRWTLMDELVGHAWSRTAALDCLIDFARTFWPTVLLLVLAWSRASGDARAKSRLAASLALGLVAESWIARMHSGAYDNVYLPALLAVALLVGPACSAVRAHGSMRGLAASALVVVQFVLLAYDPRKQLPTQADQLAGERIVADIGTAPGEVFLPYHDYLARRASKGASIHAMAIIDLLRSSDHAVAERFVARLEAALASRRWSRIVLDDTSWEAELPALLASYRRTRSLFPDTDAATFLPVTGAPWRPLYVYEPR
jgi:hypothetical protein